MSKILRMKIIFIFICIALLATLLSFFIKGEELLIGGMPRNTVSAGFPAHYLEFSYDSPGYDNLVSQKFLLFQFLSDVIIYFIVFVCFWHVVSEWLKNHNWKPLVLAITLSFIFLITNIVSSQYCGAGFPVEFYPKCEGMGGTLGLFLYGLIFDYVFWFALSVIIMAILHELFSFAELRDFLIHKNVWLTFVSAWITVATISFLAIIFHAGRELAGALVIAVICIPFLSKAYEFLWKENKGKGRRFFLSEIGYVAFGVSIGLIVISTCFNLLYVGGWFDFTDFGFVLLSYPLNFFIKFQFDSDLFLNRIILYSISFANLALITLVLDVFGAICILIYKVIIKIIKKILTKKAI